MTTSLNRKRPADRDAGIRGWNEQAPMPGAAAPPGRACRLDASVGWSSLASDRRIRCAPGRPARGTRSIAGAGGTWQAHHFLDHRQGHRGGGLLAAPRVRVYALIFLDAIVKIRDGQVVNQWRSVLAGADELRGQHIVIVGAGRCGAGPPRLGPLPSGGPSPPPMPPAGAVSAVRPRRKASSAGCLPPAGRAP